MRPGQIFFLILLLLAPRLAGAQDGSVWLQIEARPTLAAPAPMRNHWTT